MIQLICQELHELHEKLFRIQYDFEDGSVWLYMPGCIKRHTDFPEESKTRLLGDRLLVAMGQ